MPNSLNTNPLTVDVDLASFGAAQTLQHKAFGLLVYKIALVASTTTTAGTVTITNPIDSSVLYEPILVPAGLAVGSSILNGNIRAPLQWKDFRVTGVTPTGTRLFVWYKF